LSINKNAQVLGDKKRVINALFAAGEVTGGVHGDNRLMGNSQMELYVYGRIAGKNAAEYVKNVEMPKKHSLEHLAKYAKMIKQEGLQTERRSPILLPEYRGPNAIGFRGYGKEKPIKKYSPLPT
jgi:succinate dehydrogenase/fumarate reductase flavoprotein subunit